MAGQTILIVEDDPDIRDGVRILLSGEGYHILEAENGLRALELFNPEVDLVILDIMMPGMNGYEATKCIRLSNRPDGKTVPIIAMSANAFSDDIVQSKNAGMNDHLAKPLSTEKLISTIHTYLGKGTKNDN